jgi:hypothetical protein
MRWPARGSVIAVHDSHDVACVIYAAKSTEDRRGSIPGQLAECRAAIAAHPRGSATKSLPGRSSNWVAYRNRAIENARRVVDGEL